MAPVIDPSVEQLWRFARGDLAPRGFESWICGDPDIEGVLGSERYLEVISARYEDHDEVTALRVMLREVARSLTEYRCECAGRRDTAVVDMGAESDLLFSTLTEVTRRGDPWWWLGVSRCDSCTQWWLVAQEERQNDVICLRRLSDARGLAIVETGAWPEDFSTYEELLEVGLAAGSSVRFVDALYDSSLAVSIEELARARAGIGLTEIARLLNLDLAIARALATRVVELTGVQIQLDR